MDLDSVREDVLRRRGQGNLTLEPKQNKALDMIAVNKRGCSIVRPLATVNRSFIALAHKIFDRKKEGLQLYSQSCRRSFSFLLPSPHHFSPLFSLPLPLPFYTYLPAYWKGDEWFFEKYVSQNFCQIYRSRDLEFFRNAVRYAGVSISFARLSKVSG